LRSAPESRPGAIRPAAGGSGLHRGAARRRRAARAHPRGPHTAAALGGRGPGAAADPLLAPAARHAGGSVPESRGANVMPICDQGYQHWSGELSGHAWRWLAIARHGVRIGMKNWLLRVAIILAWLPAIGLAFMLCVWGLLEQKSPLAAAVAFLFEFLPSEVLADPKAYRVEFWTIAYEFFMLCELRYSMILVMLVGPSLISQDLRFNALPLYFSRPLRRIDYFLGKLGVVVWFLAMVMIFPSLIAYVLGLLFSLDLSIIPDTLPVLLASLAYGLLVSVVSGLVILALSSLTRNSRYIALAWLAVILIGSITGLILEIVSREQRREEQYRAVQS